MSGDRDSPNSSNYTETQNAQRLAAMDDVRRIMRDEVRTDWIDLWEERWRKRLGKLQSQSTQRGKSKVRAVTEAGTDTERETGGGESTENDDEDDGDDGVGWDGAGAGWDADLKDGEEIWVHRGDDSDFLKAADAYPMPIPTSSRLRLPPPVQRENSGSPFRGEGWTASVTRLMGGMGFGSSPPQSQRQSQAPWSNAASVYPSSSTTPSFTAGTTPSTISANPSAPGSPSQLTASSPYRFVSPDSITPSLAVLREKRNEELQRQMDLNDPEGNVGLRCWVERRDAWTGADGEGSVRVGRSKFAENPLTASVNEAAYPTIYSKCIKKALPPVVPINLRHITNAMVAGWKKDNEWPPAPAAPEPSFSKRRPPRGPGGPPATDGGGARRVLGML